VIIDHWHTQAYPKQCTRCVDVWRLSCSHQ